MWLLAGWQIGNSNICVSLQAQGQNFKQASKQAYYELMWFIKLSNYKSYNFYCCKIYPLDLKKQLETFQVLKTDQIKLILLHFVCVQRVITESKPVPFWLFQNCPQIVLMEQGKVEKVTYIIPSFQRVKHANKQIIKA